MLIAGASALLLSDYHVGLLTPALVETARTLAQEAQLPITADAQGELGKYAGFSVVKCNADEARDYLRRDLHSDEDFAAAAVELRETLELAGRHGDHARRGRRDHRHQRRAQPAAPPRRSPTCTTRSAQATPPSP